MITHTRCGNVPVIEDRTRKWLTFWHRRHSTGLFLFLHHIHTRVWENNGYAKKGGFHIRFCRVEKMFRSYLEVSVVNMFKDQGWRSGLGKKRKEGILMNMLQSKPTISTNWTGLIHLKQKRWAKISMALRWTLYKWNRLPHCEQHTVTLPVHKEAIKFFNRANSLLLLDFQTNSKIF